jgi:hypothetical protein
MTTAKPGAKQTANASHVMTVMVMHGKMEIPLMENARITMEIKLKTISQ